MKAVEDTRDAYRKGYRAPCVVLSTGAGKTIIFCHIVERVSARNKRVYILVHRQELLRQTSKHLGKLGVAHGLIAPGHTMTGDSVQVASVQTLARRLGKVRAPDLIVIDECHHTNAATWREIVNHFSTARILGVTATPCRLDGTGLGKDHGGYFDVMIQGPTVRDLIDADHLSQTLVYAPPVGADLTGLHTRMGDFVQSEVEARLDKPKITGSAIEHYMRLCPNVPAIAFCASVKHAEHIAEAFSAAGIPATSIDGTMPDNLREYRLNALSTGKIKVLTNYNIVSEGFDLPSVTAAILLRPTQSLSLFLQQVGRAMRPCPEIGKTHAIILDHVGNCLRHGLPDEVREWSLEGVKKKKKKDEIQVRQCEKCYAVFSMILNMCPQCGEPVQVTGKSRPREEIQTEDGELIQISQAMFERRQKRMEQGRAQTLEELIAMGKQRGYHPQWAYRIYHSRKNKERQKSQQLAVAI